MTIEQLGDKVTELSLKLDALKESFQIYQQNINNNISWFYALLGLMAAIIGAAVYFLVKNIVNERVEKELDKRIIRAIQQFPPVLWASGTGSIVENKLIITGLKDFSKERLLSLNILKLDGTSFDYKYKINDNGTIEVDFNVNGKINLEKYAQWTVIWLRKEYERNL
jgi:hypothetical protein